MHGKLWNHTRVCIPLKSADKQSGLGEICSVAAAKLSNTKLIYTLGETSKHRDSYFNLRGHVIALADYIRKLVNLH